MMKASSIRRYEGMILCLVTMVELVVVFFSPFSDFSFSFSLLFCLQTSRVLNSGPVESSFEVKSSNSTVLDLVADALKKMLYIFKDFRGLIAKFGEDGLRLIRAHPLFCEVSYEVFNLTKVCCWCAVAPFCFWLLNEVLMCNHTITGPYEPKPYNVNTYSTCF